MLKQTEGSHAVAEAVALCRPEVICAYPISPQTHIVEGLGEMVKAGEVANCEFINVESEFAAMSVAIGSSATGARTYTATASQGLLFMVEAVYNASGLGLPIVMTVANRAIGAPINIWNDHSDSLSQRDCGWIQLFAETNQEALDLHIQAFKLAEEISLPVMVCMDGFILTHAYERVDVPTQEQVDAFLPPYEPRQVLDPKEPVSIGAMVGPEAFSEVRYLAHAKQMQALERIPQLAEQFKAVFGRDSGGLTTVTWLTMPTSSSSPWARSSARSRTPSTRCARRASGSASSASPRIVRSRSTTSAPRCRTRSAWWSSRRVWRSASAASCRPTCAWRCPACNCTAIPWSPASAAARSRASRCARLFSQGRSRRTRSHLTFLDLDWNVVNKQLERERTKRRSGPAAESMLRDIGVGCHPYWLRTRR
jgi:pyruvate ferredoxin oxidoreductase alpha subunit